MAIEDLEANRSWQPARSGPPAAVASTPPPVDASILGLYSFGATCTLISLYNCRASGVIVPNVVVGMALAIGGLGELIAGIFEFIRGSTYTGTLFLFYTGFWLSYAAILLPDTGIIAAYADHPEMLGDALGIFLAIFAFVTLLFLAVGARKTIALVSTLVLLEITFVLLSIGNFTGNTNVTQAGGVVGVITAGGAFYIGTGGFMATEPRPLFTLPMGVL
ncbi:hypothetical protein BDZ89DRAFT_1147171 [Hymenopellis radicata]|nr:hypothetical protein BDZ89DRAFT_1147171 [Hymenopellis radicata]